MGEHEHKRLGEEHPRSDQVQIILLFVLIGVWIIDSFILNIYTMTFVPLPIRLSISVALLGLGTFLVLKSHRLVIDSDEPKLVDWGVYSVTRHPMYLGSMLFELGIVTTTLSIPALLLWLVLFVAYNQFAAYEENSLVYILENDYRNYMKKVKRWGLF